MVFKNRKLIKPKAVKKDEIIKAYEEEMLIILEKNKSDKQLQIKNKIDFLKRVNYELSMNMFFEEKESKEILEKLSNLELK